MSEISRSYSPLFKEPGFVAKIDWSLSRREFSASVKRLFEELKRHGAALPLPLVPGPGIAAVVLAGIECRGCGGLCCARASTYISLFPPEAAALGVTGSADDKGQISLPLPCRFLKKGQCSSYGDRPVRCRFYPVQIGGSAGSNQQDTFVGLDSFCSESPRLGLRIYLAAYDLAHGMKTL